MRYLILLQNQNFIVEKDYERLVEIDNEEKATKFSEKDANSIIEYLGEGEKVPCDDN